MKKLGYEHLYRASVKLCNQEMRKKMRKLGYEQVCDIISVFILIICALAIYGVWTFAIETIVFKILATMLIIAVGAWFLGLSNW